MFEFFFTRSNLSTPQKWLLDLLASGYSSKAGIKVTQDEAIKVSAVFACVNVISSTIASLPFPVYRRQARGKKHATNLSIYELLHDLPNPETTAYDFWVMYIVNLLLTGDAFAYIKRDGNGQILELWNIPSGNVTTYRNKTTGELYYKIRDDETNTEAYYYSENVMHTRGMRFKKKSESLDPIALACEALGLATALEEYGSKYFKNGANPGAVVTFPGTMQDESFKRFKDSFNEKYAGIGNSSKVLFLESGSEYIKIGNNPEESQSLESRKHQVIEIARFFNVPPHKIMELDRATFNNIEQLSIEFVQSCINPMCVRIEQTVFKDLLLPSQRKQYFAKFNLMGLLRGDSTARKDFYTAGIQNGWYSPNDVRELEDMNAYEGGDVYMVNGNMLPIQFIEANAQKLLGEGGGGSDEDSEGSTGQEEKPAATAGNKRRNKSGRGGKSKDV
jgi:HK97 family phage portal protein